MSSAIVSQIVSDDDDALTACVSNDGDVPGIHAINNADAVIQPRVVTRRRAHGLSTATRTRLQPMRSDDDDDAREHLRGHAHISAFIPPPTTPLSDEFKIRALCYSRFLPVRLHGV